MKMAKPEVVDTVSAYRTDQDSDGVSDYQDVEPKYREYENTYELASPQFQKKNQKLRKQLL